MKIMTIGGYGFSEQSFLQTLQQADVDTLVDIRQRRGMRGARYAFLNSKRLQHLLAAADIKYVYASELAPTTVVRDSQKKDDETGGVTKRERTELSPAFVAKYQSDILAKFEFDDLRQSLRESRSIALFCVEARPAACHRILAAEHLSKILDTEQSVGHLRP